MLKDIIYTHFKELMKTMPLKELKELKSFVVTGDGECAFIVTVPQNGFVRESVKEVCMLGNNAGGKDIQEVINGKE